MELKKCEDCKEYLIPIETDIGNIPYHPPNKDCKHSDLNKALRLDLIITDQNLFEMYQNQHGKTLPYTLQSIFEHFGNPEKTGKKGLWDHLISLIPRGRRREQLDHSKDQELG